jgi:predicted phosphohydrolase
MNVWAIGDLHLGFSTGKWMDRFGEHWRDHHLKVEAAWRACVAAEDIVLLPGDLSWAMKPEQAAQDLRWLAGLPGRKVLIKGNHDYWWPGSHKKLVELLPPGIHALKKRAVVLDGIPIIGVRGADFLPREGEDPAGVDASLRRERRELLLSIAHLKEIHSGDEAPIALFHYPPFRAGGVPESAFTRILEDAGCRHCLFGHLHAPAEWERVFQGERRGVEYRLVSCDALGFAPLLVEERG